MYVNEDIYKRVMEKKKQLDAVRPLPKAALESLRKNFAIELAYNSNAIEGNTLTLRETRLAIEEGITVSGKTLKEYFEAINHQKAFDYLEKLVKKKTKISEKIIKELHSFILSNIDERYAGQYRDVNVKITGAGKSPPRFEKLGKLMKGFVGYVNKNPDNLNNVELSSFIHYRLVEIHPFIDGNGRCARLLMNLYLMQHGFPVAIVLKVDRKKYYDRLKTADKGNIKPFINFMARNIERSLDLYLDAVKGGEDFMSLAEAAKEFPYSQEYLSLLARRGKIGAVKIGRNWHVKKKAIEEYIQEKGRK